jgi:hypothetical protein
MRESWSSSAEGRLKSRARIQVHFRETLLQLTFQLLSDIEILKRIFKLQWRVDLGDGSHPNPLIKDMYERLRFGPRYLIELVVRLNPELAGQKSARSRP